MVVGQKVDQSNYNETSFQIGTYCPFEYCEFLVLNPTEKKQFNIAKMQTLKYFTH